MSAGVDAPTLITVALAALALGAAALRLGQTALKRRNGGKPEIQLQVADAIRVEIDRDKLATVILTSEKHTLEITALRKDIEDLKRDK